LLGKATDEQPMTSNHLKNLTDIELTIASCVAIQEASKILEVCEGIADEIDRRKAKRTHTFSDRLKIVDSPETKKREEAERCKGWL